MQLRYNVSLKAHPTFIFCTLRQGVLLRQPRVKGWRYRDSQPDAMTTWPWQPLLQAITSNNFLVFVFSFKNRRLAA